MRGVIDAAAVFALAGFGEFVGTVVLLNGQATDDQLAPYILGFLFASTSLAWGVVGAFGTSLASDCRLPRRWLGALVVAVAMLFWVATALLAAHMRAVIEQGGSGTVAEILDSIHHGLFRPLASPMALILIAASAFATAAAWVKWLDHIGRPFGSRGEHTQRRWAENELRRGEEAHRGAVSLTVAGSLARLDGLESEAWRPANDGLRLEREVGLALAQARECFQAVDRITRSLITQYAATFRRMRPGVDVSAAVQLDPIESESLGDPKSLHEKVAVLSQAAAEVANTVAERRNDLHKLEVANIRMIEERYASTRNNTGVAAAAPQLLPRLQ